MPIFFPVQTQKCWTSIYIYFFPSCSLQQIMFISGTIFGRPWNGSWRLITFALCGRVDVKTFPRTVCHFRSDYHYIGDSSYLCDWIVPTMACKTALYVYLICVWRLSTLLNLVLRNRYICKNIAEKLTGWWHFFCIISLYPPLYLTLRYLN